MADDQQHRLDERDPDAMADREDRLRAELDALDHAKLAARTEALDAIRRAIGRVRTAGQVLDDVVAEARAYGCTWQQIADAAGMARPSAWQRWAR